MKTICFEGDSLEIIREFPDRARNRAGFELDRVQRGLEPLNWKPITSIGQGTREIRIQIGGQFRVIYVARLGNSVHVLHAFHKKTQKQRCTVLINIGRSLVKIKSFLNICEHTDLILDFPVCR